MLSPLERDVLDLEGHFPQAQRSDGARERVIQDLLQITPTRYSQVLASLLNRPDAYTYAPVTLKRLRDRVQRRRDETQPA